MTVLDVSQPTPSNYPRPQAASTSYVLLDYYNIPKLHRHRGAVSVVQEILNALDIHHFPTGTRLHVRFYGGWYRKAGLSQPGQDLSTELRGTFPNPMVVSTRQTTVQFRVGADLARSLLLDPAYDLLHTLRRGLPPVYNVATLPFRGCTRPESCKLACIDSLIHRRVCPDNFCSTRISAVFPRPKQQKLVDTMLVSDLIYLAHSESDPVIVVSSDDDLWPGIRTALHLGVPVHHVHTLPRRTSDVYSSAVTTSYYEYNI